MITGNQKVWNKVFTSGIIFITRFLKIGQQVQKITVAWGEVKTARHKTQCSENFQFFIFRKGTNRLTPWSIVFLEKLTGSQLLKKFLAFYGT